MRTRRRSRRAGAQRRRSRTEILSQGRWGARRIRTGDVRTRWIRGIGNGCKTLGAGSSLRDKLGGKEKMFLVCDTATDTLCFRAGLFELFHSIINDFASWNSGRLYTFGECPSCIARIWVLYLCISLGMRGSLGSSRHMLRVRSCTSPKHFSTPILT